MILLKITLNLLFVGFGITQVNCARILCVFPSPAKSHQSVFRAYTQELAKQGHELVIVTTEPALPKNRPPDNITEIDVGPLSYPLFHETLTEMKNIGLIKRGVIIDLDSYFDEKFWSLYIYLCEEQFKHSDIQKLINDPNQKFDLLVVEAYFDYPLILSTIFKAPLIQISSFYGYAKNYKIVGAISQHPLLCPQKYRNSFDGVSIWEKLKEIYWEWRFMTHYKNVKEIGEKELKKNFGPKTPSIDELRNNVDLLFINVHPIYDDNRPVPPSVVNLGALHMKPAKELPQDLKSYLDHSKRGVVYVSLGTIVRPSEMEKELLNQFLKAFKQLPYDILWKSDAENLLQKPENVKIQKWFPQRDLLMHPNIKVFVTQGGLQSTDEAIDAVVPMVGIPFLADQWYNVYKSEQLGVGVKLDTFTLTADDIVNGVLTVINNDSYKYNIKRLKSFIQDQPETAMQRAIWWTEHILRHGSGRHLRARGANISWTEYLMLDIILPVFAILLIVLVFIALFIARVLRSIFKQSNTKFKRQ